ncbi:FKBP-type peptidyl-prolyl cis-trans isomerase [Sphingobacterium psychroaquaticum]|uniref:FKBP-type peptidyl-prolyl cis-trans isomerase n=1 Tax=Sphingobacterium psychroaquaticum TaxID=561061 RepID=UPI00106D73E4|nr:FKBP-type peptidyl-prolyl cis-trans isomerase [Sphingobacterium psychroaquaticum]QBQ40843.1 FKBP-type peptidyl-prolyl cis-trans isomerase [Sphingobacterium psychroaquaticum]
MNKYCKIAAALLFVTGMYTLPTYAQAKKMAAKPAAKAAVKTAPKTVVDSVSYAVGMDVAKSLASSGVKIQSASFMKGLEDVLQSKTALFGVEEKMRIIKDAFNKAADLKMEALKKEENAFFATLKTKPNVKHLQDGLYYEVIAEGNGPKPTVDDEVNVHYKGTLANGKVFDSSYDRGTPLDLSLARVIRGWQLGIPLMSVGAKYRLYIPSDLGYGERGAGEIPPFSALVFDIELLGIKAKDATN